MHLSAPRPPGPMAAIDPPSAHMRSFTRADFESLPQIRALPAADREAIRVVSAVFPFKVNSYVVDQLIDWDRAPDDPIFRIAFPDREMLDPEDFQGLRDLLARDAGQAEVARRVADIRLRMNPHPAEQQTRNLPRLDGRPLAGMQHKYRETVLFFPAEGQTCHSYCTFCFRWPQFVGMEGMRIATRQADDLCEYLRRHRDVTDVLLTGGDPLTMPAARLRRYLEPLLDPSLEHVHTIRLGTRSLAWWPSRYLGDPDAEELLGLFEDVARRGRHLVLVTHWAHPRELESPLARMALQRVRATGAEVRGQGPLLRGVNDDAGTLERLWSLQVRQGCLPYYLFVERDTGARRRFEVPLVRAWELFRAASSRVSGLARTVRGPIMSVGPGKVCLDGPARFGGRTVLALRYLQARDPERVGRPFFADLDPEATWWDALRPASEEDRPYFEP